MYMLLGLRGKILSYNFAKHRLSLIDPPDSYDKGSVHMLTEDGLLGLSGIRGFNLHLCSRNECTGNERWVQCSVIEQQKLLPVDNPFKRTIVTGFAEDACVIFTSTEIGAFAIELKTGRARKVAGPGRYYPVIPFSIFYTQGTVPAL